MGLDRYVLSPFFLDEELPGLLELAEEGWAVNAPPLPDGGSAARMSTVHRPLAEIVQGAVEGGERPVSVAGDCCAMIGVMAGLERAGVRPMVIWFDAHGDFNTPETSPSGFVGGMPLAILVGRGDQTLPEAVGLEPVDENRVVLAGARTLDPGEAELVRASRITHLERVGELLEQPLPEGPLLVHFDTDVVDPSEVPAHHYPAPGGPSSEAVREVFHHLAASRRVAAVSVSTWDPRLDEDGASRRVSMSLVRSLAGA
jgi:arginase